MGGRIEAYLWGLVADPFENLCCALVDLLSHGNDLLGGEGESVHFQTVGLDHLVVTL